MADAILAYSHEHHGSRRACSKLPSIASTQGCSVLIMDGW
jgi:hypothetical protein